MSVPTVLLAGALLMSAVQSHAENALSQSAQGASQSDSGPYEVVQTAAQNMLHALDANRDAYRKDPSKVGQLVDKYLLPHFDTEFAARLVLGQHWRSATP